MYKLCNGTLVKREIKVCNNGPQDATNVVTSLTIPAGIEVYATTPEYGTYNTSTDEWTISSIPFVEPNPKCYKLTVQFKITDASLAPFSIPYSTTADESETNVADNSGTIEITRECPSVYILNAGNYGGNCCGRSWEYCDDLLSDPTPGAQPASVNAACLCGDLKQGSIPCNDCCKSQFALVTDSEVNLDSVTIDANTGIYKVVPTDPTLVWSFQYEISCTNCYGCDDETVTGPFGPATVTGPALFECNDVLNCINIEELDTDSIDMSVTGAGTTGDPFVISADAIIDPSTNNILSITEDGLYAPREVATISYDSDTDQISYLDEAGNTTTLSLNSGGGGGGVLQVTDGITLFGIEPGAAGNNLLTFEAGGDLSIALDGPNDKVTYSFTETDAVIVDNLDGTYTYTSEGGTTTTIDTTGSGSYREEFTELTTGNTVTVTATPVDLDTYPSERVQIFRNGLLELTTDYSISGNDVIFTDPFGFSDVDSEATAANGETVVVQVIG